MRITTVNVNGIRAAARKGMGEWLAATAPEVLLLEEVRADETTASALLPGYESVIWPCRIKGRAGVGVAVRDGAGYRLGEVRRGVAPEGVEEPDVDSGRWLEVDLEPTADAEQGHPATALTVIAAYLHSGQVGTPKLDQKLAHLELVDARMSELLAAQALGDGADRLHVAIDDGCAIPGRAGDHQRQLVGIGHAVGELGHLPFLHQVPGHAGLGGGGRLLRLGGEGDQTEGGDGGDQDLEHGDALAFRGITPVRADGSRLSSRTSRV